MKDLNLLVWLTQLGLGIAVPMGGCIWGAIWLRDRYGLGSWVIVCGCILGLFFTVNSMLGSFRMLEDMMKRKQQKEEKKLNVPPVSYNEHD